MNGGPVVAFVVAVGTLAGGPGSAAAAPPEPPEPPTPFVHATNVHDPDCVIEIQRGDSLSLIAEAMPDTAVTYFDLAAENGIVNADEINAGDLLDICVGNQIDDIDGGSRDDEVEVVDEQVAAQQRKINELFAGRGMPELLVDGIAGPLTRQQLCAFRSAFGLPISRAEMVPGSAEEQRLMATTALPTYTGVPDRWLLIDKTCQIMFVGDATSLVFIFRTSTGEAGYETRDQNAARAFRFDPAIDNDGWHDSTTFPAAADNPLNGNMYKPLYFDNGQAIHGSYNVPPEPASKGCARLLVEDHDALLSWLGLLGATSPVWSARQINLVVHVRGQFIADPAD
jgi:hypothetical protein